ncbi:hypothetical protein SAMN05216480_101178 [Pustulibacterium marinum]|uniref:DUF4625 domain-containing protein n=1 Tax=Pustulibacterium marinum TaxID=1224947 RepID=A0A1I7EU82_9FLAO|nr:hypothetical protein [Pustulibacterium marinum]SFU27470.1 hypothetical protein SAMN05216480_101178 [Pustulibacterium marinum]
MKKLIVLLVMSMALFSCSLDDDTVNFHYEYLETAYAEFPEEMTVNGSYQINLYYYLPTDCYAFNGIEYYYTGDFERTVAINVTVNDASNCETLEEAEPDITYFNFNPQMAGTYTFKFLSGMDESTGEYTYIDYEVEVLE